MKTWMAIVERILIAVAVVAGSAAWVVAGWAVAKRLLLGD